MHLTARAELSPFPKSGSDSEALLRFVSPVAGSQAKELLLSSHKSKGCRLKDVAFSTGKQVSTPSSELQGEGKRCLPSHALAFSVCVSVTMNSDHS